MSLDVESRLRVLLASSPRDRYRVETLEFSHSAMSETVYLWHEPYTGEITTEEGVRTVQPANFKIKLAGNEGHLDQSFEITLDTVDISDEFHEQLDLVPIATKEKVRCVFREYLSDDLTTIEAGPAVLQVETIAWQVGQAAITAVSPRFNVTRTGEIYTPRDVPMLRGFL